MKSFLTDKARWTIIAVFFAAVLLVNPLRETPIDDDCSYSWTVRHLLDYGDYRPHNWITANMPFQACWGAAFTWLVPGFFSALRVSTLALSLAGLIAFYGLALECRLDRRTALLLTLTLFSSYLYFWCTFTFMTDVPGVAWILVSLWCFAVALRRQSWWLALMGSGAACAAILTRQTGVAVPAALALTALLDRQRTTRWNLYLLGAIVPVAALALSVELGKNFAIDVHAQMMRDYWSNYSDIPLEGFWRINELLLYLAVLILPLALAFWFMQVRKSAVAYVHSRVSFTAVMMAAIGLLATGFAFLHNVYSKGGNWAMPHTCCWYDYYFAEVLRLTSVNTGVCIAAFFAAAAFWPTILRQCSPAAARPLVSGFWLLEGYALCSLGLLVIYVKFLDRYPLPLLPVLLLLLGRASQVTLRQPWVFGVLTTCALAVITVHAMQAGARLRLQEATWHGSEIASAAGVPRNRIIGSNEWIIYYSFDDFVEHYQSGQFQGDFFNEYWPWLVRHNDMAQAFVAEPDSPTHGWQLLAEVPYRDAFFRPQIVRILVRPDVYSQLKHE
jgi:hypothetical protein